MPRSPSHLWLVLACLVVAAAGCIGPGSDWPKSDSAGGSAPAAGGTPTGGADDTDPESSGKKDAGVVLDGAVRDAGLDAGTPTCTDPGAVGGDAGRSDAGVVVTADSGCAGRIEPPAITL